MIDRICSICKLSKTIDNFNWRSKLHGYRKSMCRDCQSDENAKRNYKKSYSSYNRGWNIRNKYKISEKEYDDLLSIGYCQVCKSTKKLCLDHDHGSLRIRGVLCSNCNTALGLLHDSPEKIKSLLEYLIK